MANERRTPPILPEDDRGRIIQTTPRAKALVRTVQGVNSSYAITFNDDTTIVRVYAISKDIYLRWAVGPGDACSASNFDEVIPASQVIDFGIPDKPDGTKYDYITLIGRESGATAVVIEK